MKNFEYIKILIIAIIIFLYFQSCSKGTSPLFENELSIESIYTNASISYFKISFTTQFPEASIRLYRNDSIVVNLKSSNVSNILVDQNLLPNHFYTYYATLSLDDKEPIIKSAEIELNTLDTTSQDLKNNYEEYGDIASYLKDVHIFNHENIWAVGGIRLENQWYGCLIWDGNVWTVKQLLYNKENIEPNNIVVLQSGQIWLTQGSVYYYQDGSLSMSFYDWRSWIERIWGLDEHNLFIVGENGYFFKYNGDFRWQWVNTDSEDRLFDISGYMGSDDLIKIWVLGYNTVLYFDGYSWQNIIQLLESNLDQEFVPTATFASEKFDGVLIAANNQDKSFVFYLSPAFIFPIKLFECDFIIRAITADNLNNIIVAGDNLTFAQYNGLHLKTFTNFIGNGKLFGADLLNDLAVIVGKIPNHSSVLITMNK